MQVTYLEDQACSGPNQSRDLGAMVDGDINDLCVSIQPFHNSIELIPYSHLLACRIGVFDLIRVTGAFCILSALKDCVIFS